MVLKSDSLHGLSNRFTQSPSPSAPTLCAVGSSPRSQWPRKRPPRPISGAKWRKQNGKLNGENIIYLNEGLPIAVVFDYRRMWIMLSHPNNRPTNQQKCLNQISGVSSSPWHRTVALWKTDMIPEYLMRYDVVVLHWNNMNHILGYI